MEKVTDVVMVRGEAELFERTAHLFELATEISCAARDLHTWSVAHKVAPEREQSVRGLKIRKVYQPGVLFDPALAEHLRRMAAGGAGIRITEREINETILLDRRIAIVAGDRVGGVRGYTVISSPDLVQGIQSLFEAAWHAATDLESYQARFTELGAREILEQLASGCKDETAARALGISLRTYRRRVAELMELLGASSRFQAGARAREAGLL
ncbi:MULTISPECIES: DNA-binding response regulator [unclassified Amycolatopsis]|uniref:helix-turn-helix transcriptional regulator n=1 Tax=unclassified Amycolatopsis TaxID=2618356 RepID=UPI0028745B56|nr:MULTISPECIES: DNA-binding response regulator [unclassified Amycolatopsis]MDS0132617.1 DNA-binding response regulator [Amycolatopsis sp. 505]MDS0142558.1 DNA-binding response regulator [Amycolatopsis sp. CM201R]